MLDTHARVCVSLYLLVNADSKVFDFIVKAFEKGRLVETETGFEGVEQTGSNIRKALKSVTEAAGSSPRCPMSITVFINRIYHSYQEDFVDYACISLNKEVNEKNGYSNIE